jgi:hypothetical protein
MDKSCYLNFSYLKKFSVGGRSCSPSCKTDISNRTLDNEVKTMESRRRNQPRSEASSRLTHRAVNNDKNAARKTTNIISVFAKKNTVGQLVQQSPSKDCLYKRTFGKDNLHIMTNRRQQVNSNKVTRKNLAGSLKENLRVINSLNQHPKSSSNTNRPMKHSATLSEDMEAEMVARSLDTYKKETVRMSEAATVTKFCIFHNERMAEFFIDKAFERVKSNAGLCPSCAVKLASKSFPISEITITIKPKDRTTQIADLMATITDCETLFTSKYAILKSNKFSLQRNFDIQKAKIDKFFMFVFQVVEKKRFLWEENLRQCFLSEKNRIENERQAISERMVILDKIKLDVFENFPKINDQLKDSDFEAIVANLESKLEDIQNSSKHISHTPFEFLEKLDIKKTVDAVDKLLEEELASSYQGKYALENFNHQNVWNEQQWMIELDGEQEYTHEAIEEAGQFQDIHETLNAIDVNIPSIENMMQIAEECNVSEPNQPMRQEMIYTDPSSYDTRVPFDAKLNPGPRHAVPHFDIQSSDSSVRFVN